MGKVTAIIPAFNPGAHLTRSLGSVLAQRDVDLDVVVVDDGSAQDITDTPGLDDPRVTLVRTPNRGVSAARNLGVAMTDAEYIAFLDQDDEWAAPDKLARQIVAQTEHPDAGFVHTGFTWVLADREQDASTPAPVSYEDNLAGRCYVCLSSILVRRDRYVTVGGHDLTMAQQQDWDLVLKLLRLYGPAVAVNGPLVRYHVHGGNASGDYVRAEAESDRVFRRNTSQATASLVRRGRRKADRLYASKGVDASREALHRRDFAGSVRHLANAGRMDPTSVPRAIWGTVRRRIGNDGGAWRQRQD
ncbi:glycosyltransferase family A protein [Ornithinimicrobium sp. W1665]|uniref:glycosyltransferase family A protein n=1 Tax=Ornithinimicrobium sp. W1665 TaxID=3416666 RepID=UPI003CE6879C